MHNPQFKSKSQKLSLSAQTITLVKQVFSTYIIKKAKIAFQFQVVQPVSKTFSFEKKRLIRIYHILPVLIATLLLVSCQKEELTNPDLNSTTTNESLASAAGNQAPVVDAGAAKTELYS